MLWGRPRLVVAFDAGQVWGLLTRQRLPHTQVVAAAQQPVPAGALVPAAFERNLARVAEVCDALRAIRSQLALRDGQRADLILPAGIARPTLLESNGHDAGAEALRFRLAAALPYPASEAVVGTLRLSPKHLLAAAARRSVIAEYESVTAAAGLTPRRVELAPFLALAGLLRRPLPTGALDIVLGEVAVSLARWEAGGVTLVRTRLRATPGDDDVWLAGEIERIADAGHERGMAAVRLAGAGASALAELLRMRGRETLLAWDLPQPPSGMRPAELSWLGGVLR